MKQGLRIHRQRLPRNSRSWHVGRSRLAMLDNQLVVIIAIGTGCINLESLSRDALPTGQRIDGEDFIRLRLAKQRPLEPYEHVAEGRLAGSVRSHQQGSPA